MAIQWPNITTPGTTEPFTLPHDSQLMLRFTYTGTFSPDRGLYRSAPFTAYDASVSPQESVLIVTQLERQGARHVLPSVDEPLVKVWLQVS